MDYAKNTHSLMRIIYFKGEDFMETKTNKNNSKDKELKLKILAAGTTVCSVSLGVICYLAVKDACNYRIENDIYREAYEEITRKLEEKNDTAELVKRVVGGPLIDRLIKNEELKLSRTENSISNLLRGGLDELKKITLKEKEGKKQNILETIADYISVKEALQ